MARAIQRLIDFIDLRFVGDLHGDDSDSIFSGQVKNVRQTFLAVSLKGVGTRSGLVGPHARAYLPIIAQSSHHQLDVFSDINGTQSSEDMQSILTEAQSLIIEVRAAAVIVVATTNSIFLGDAHYALDAWQRIQVLSCDC